MMNNLHTRCPRLWIMEKNAKAAYNIAKITVQLYATGEKRYMICIANQQ